MRGLIFAAALACGGLTGCVESEQPPFAAEDLVFEPALLGDWELVPDPTDLVASAPNAKKETYRITVGPDGSYISTPLGKDKSAPAPLWLFKIGDRYFAAQKGLQRLSENPKIVYTVWRVVVRGSELQLWDIEFASLLNENPKLASFKTKPDNERGSGYFDGPTKEVRALLAAHSDDNCVWFVSLQYRRTAGLKVTEAGFLGKKQRTLDYWAQLRHLLHSSTLTVWGSSNVSGWYKTSDHIKNLPKDGVDAEAVAAGASAIALCNAMEEYADKRKPPADPLASLIRLTTGEPLFDPATAPPEQAKVVAKARESIAALEASRTKLAAQFKAEFLPIK